MLGPGVRAAVRDVAEVPHGSGDELAGVQACGRMTGDARTRVDAALPVGPELLMSGAVAAVGGGAGSRHGPGSPYTLGMKPVALAAVMLLLSLTACSSSRPAAPESRAPEAKPSVSRTPRPSKTPAPAPTTAVPTPDQTEAKLAQFEKENGIGTSGWYAHVKRKEIKFGSSLWIHTDLSNTGAAKETAARMCGAYAQYVLVDPKVTTTFIRALDGTQLAKCGPAA